MRVFPNFTVAIVLIACTILWAASGAYSCDSCGRECAAACGTRHFRTCCFNYLRKRSGTPPSAAARDEEVINYMPHLTRARKDDNWWRPGGGFAVYRGYLGADELPAETDNDFDVELVKVVGAAAAAGGGASNSENILLERSVAPSKTRVRSQQDI